MGYGLALSFQSSGRPEVLESFSALLGNTMPHFGSQMPDPWNCNGSDGHGPCRLVGAAGDVDKQGDSWDGGRH